MRTGAGVSDGLEISWTPEGSVVFPAFQGKLVVRAHDRADSSCIELDGSYTSPSDAVGQPFDAAIGRQIAHATARQLLEGLKDAIERSH